MNRFHPRLASPGFLVVALLALPVLACSGPSAQTGPASPGESGDIDLPREAPAQGWASTLSVEHPLVGRIWSVDESRFVTRATMLERVAEARFVLLGEKHDNADHHRLQAAVIRAMVAIGRRPSVVFEMIDRSLQPRVDEELAGSSVDAPVDVDAFGQAIAWAESGWPAWEIYRPVFAATLEGHLPVIAAQLPREQAMDLARGGALPERLVRQYKLDRPLPEPLHKALLEELHASHCGHMPASMMPSMSNVQRARDAIMADKLLQHATDGGAILIAGNGHVRADRGVPWYVPLPERDVMTIGFLEVADGLIEPAAYAEYHDGALPFDYVWFTPRDNDIDRCKELEEHMKQMKAGHGDKAPGGDTAPGGDQAPGDNKAPGDKAPGDKAPDGGEDE